MCHYSVYRVVGGIWSFGGYLESLTAGTLEVCADRLPEYVQILQQDLSTSGNENRTWLAKLWMPILLGLE